MGWPSAVPRKAWKESVTWAQVCQLLLGPGVCPCALSWLPHILSSNELSGVSALLLTSAQALASSLTWDLHVQQLNSLRTSGFLSLCLKLPFLRALIMQVTVLEEKFGVCSRF